MPLLFVLLALFFSKISWKFFNKNFLFILRGDLVSGTFYDYFFSFCLIGIPLFTGLFVTVLYQIKS